MPRIIQIIETTAKRLRNTISFNDVISYVPSDACCNMFYIFFYG